MLFVYHGDMKTKDFRSLNPEAQEDIRKKAVAAGRSGRTQGEVAAIFGVTRQTVNAWMRQYGEGGEKALKAKRRGRPKGGSVDPWQARQWAPSGRYTKPHHIRFPFCLWTRE